jgi:hypothetical protein
MKKRCDLCKHIGIDCGPTICNDDGTVNKRRYRECENHSAWEPMSNIKRICPDNKTALIKWIEDNFHNIDQFVFVARMSNSVTTTIYDCFTYYDSVAMTGIAQNVMHELEYDDAFICKERE